MVGCGMPMLLASTILASACTAAQPAGATLPPSLQLQVGQSVVLSDGDLAIGFQSVTSDSRCGKGAVCIWEGDAAVLIWLQAASGDREERELHTAASQGPDAIDYAGYRIRLLALFPTPISGRAIATADYVAIVNITRGSAAGDALD